MAKTKVTSLIEENITIPLTLAKLLSAEEDEFVTNSQVEDVRSIGRALLRVIIQTKNSK